MSYTRKYVTLKNNYADDPDANPTITGVVYFEGDTPNDLFYDNLNIEEANLIDGRWLLILGNEQNISNNFEFLERRLLDWATDEGYEVARSFGPIDF